MTALLCRCRAFVFLKYRVDDWLVAGDCACANMIVSDQAGVRRVASLRLVICIMAGLVSLATDRPRQKYRPSEAKRALLQ